MSMSHDHNECEQLIVPQTVVGIRVELKKCGLSTTGKKTVIAKRLAQHYAEVTAFQKNKHKKTTKKTSTKKDAERKKKKKFDEEEADEEPKEPEEEEDEEIEFSAKKNQKKKQKTEEVDEEEATRLKECVLKSRGAFLGLQPSASLRTTDECVKAVLLSTDTDVQACVPSVRESEKENGKTLAQIDNIFTAEECGEIFKNVQNKLQDLSNKYEHAQRKGSRLVCLDELLATLLFHRLKPLIMEKINNETAADNNSNESESVLSNNENVYHETEKIGGNSSEHVNMEDETTATKSDKKDVFQPLGFAVSGGEWKLEGVNECMRVNSYKEGGFFSCHKDAQYCPTGDKRSLFSCVIYLNDSGSGDFTGGETEFFFPHSPEPTPADGETINQEITRLGGLEKGFRSVKVCPKTGSGVMFTHDLLHRGCPTKLTSTSSPGKLVLKTDILVSRVNPQGFHVNAQESAQYLMCVNYFREAQQQELKMNNKKANELYEQALSLRFAHPRSSSSSSSSQDDRKSSENISADQFLSSEAWLIVFDYAGGWSVDTLVEAFPSLAFNYQLYTQRLEHTRKVDENLPLFIPQRDFHYGAVTSFVFPSAEFFKANHEGCCRVAAMYAFFLMGVNPGEPKDDEEYAVRYDPKTQRALAVSLETLLSDAFYKRECVGSVYKVNLQANSQGEQRKLKSKNKKKESLQRSQAQVEADFNESVDREYMIHRHNAQFVGIDIAGALHAHLKTKEDPEIHCEDRLNPKMLAAIQLVTRNSGDEQYDEDRLTSSWETSDVWENSTDTSVDRRLDYVTQMLEQNQAPVAACRLSKICGTVDCACACGIGGFQMNVPGGVDDVSRMNHLVFDFGANEMAVSIDASKDCKCDYSVYSSAISSAVLCHFNKEEHDDDHKFGGSTCYRVDISKVIGPEHAFNHASCNCSFPDTDVDSVTCSDYPSLTHVHVVALEDRQKMIATVVYGGVVAL